MCRAFLSLCGSNLLKISYCYITAPNPLSPASPPTAPVSPASEAECWWSVIGGLQPLLWGVSRLQKYRGKKSLNS